MQWNILRKKDKLEYPAQYILLGQSYLLKRNFDKAIAAYHKALRMEANNTKTHLFLANAWFKKGINCANLTDKNREKWLYKAMIHYKKAESLSPDSVIGEWARRRLKEVHHNLTASKYTEILKKIHKKGLS